MDSRIGVENRLGPPPVAQLELFDEPWFRSFMGRMLDHLLRQSPVYEVQRDKGGYLLVGKSDHVDAFTIWCERPRIRQATTSSFLPRATGSTDTARCSSCRSTLTAENEPKALDGNSLAGAGRVDQSTIGQGGSRRRCVTSRASAIRLCDPV